MATRRRPGAETEAYYRRHNVKQRRARLPFTDRTVPSTLGAAANLDLPAIRINATLAAVTAQRKLVAGNVSVYVGGVLRAEIAPVGSYELVAAGATWNNTGHTVVRLAANVPAAFPTSGTVYLQAGASVEAYTYSGVTGTDLTGISPALSQDYSGGKATLGSRNSIGTLLAGDLVHLRIVDGFVGVDEIRFFGNHDQEINRTKINASG